MQKIERPKWMYVDKKRERGWQNTRQETKSISACDVEKRAGVNIWKATNTDIRDWDWIKILGFDEEDGCLKGDTIYRDVWTKTEEVSSDIIDSEDIQRESEFQPHSVRWRCQ